MDPNAARPPQVSRPPSAPLPPQPPPPLHQYPMQSPYGMPQAQAQPPPQPQPQPHTLPPLQHPQTQSPVPHSYMSQQQQQQQQPYRHDMSRYPTTSGHDVYGAAPTASVPPHTPVNSLPPSSFLGAPPAQQHPFQSHSMMPHNTTAQAYPQLAPAPPRDRRPDYGVPPPGPPYSQPESKGAAWAGAETMPPSTAGYVSKDSPRTQVVGSQGRRGILPSVPGRAAPITPNGVNGGSPKSATVPAKDADGKFPCPHCNKTYLHAKHLKRHLLRHTGDRPYMCVLCKDTFSRSDILKRHFQKCSLRRGNPSGVSHLSHPHAHLKRAQAAGVVPKPVQGDVSSSISPSTGLMGTTFGEDTVNGVAAASHQPRFTDHHQQQPLGYPMHSAGGLNRGPHDHAYAPNQAHQRSSWMAEPPKHNSYLMQSVADTGSQSHVDLPPIDGSKGPQAPPDAKRPVMPAGGQHHPNHGGEIDWSTVLQPGAHENYMNPVFPSTMAPPPAVSDSSMHAAPVDNSDRKYYPASTSAQQPQPQQQQQESGGGLNGLYLASTTLGGDGTTESHSFWKFNFLEQTEALQSKSDRLVDFCLRAELQEPSKRHQRQQDSNCHGDALLKECLTAENVKHFLQLFANYHTHWPYLHIPTFDFLNAYDGLALAICCIGAVYSDRLTQPRIRDLVECARAAFERSSRVLKILRPPDDDDDDPGGGGGVCVPDNYDENERMLPSDLEEIQALFLLHNLGIWHGDPDQRARARQDLTLFSRFARRFGLLNPSGPKDPRSYSPLHIPPSGNPISMEDWDWATWVEQEKRSRLVYVYLLSDMAHVLYFNRHPHFNPHEIKLPLPADDETWEAPDAQQCAETLGLAGPEIQAISNITGSRRLRQVEMHYAVAALQNPMVDFRSRSTNAYSKFILIHSLLEQIWLAQRQSYYEGSQETLQLRGEDFTASSMYTPLTRHMWQAVEGNSVVSGATPATSPFETVSPTTSINIDLALSSSTIPDANTILQSADQALSKWKSLWDEDTALQYPPPVRRLGICRDGLHFYWLGRSFLRPEHMDAWRLEPDRRFGHVISLLNKARVHTQVDVATRGEELGAVADVDKEYGVEDLTFDMKKLFTPIE